jgi:3D (Asp-Asp-Asp) domain-containing protein
VVVDPRRIKLGAVLYLPSLAGVILPSGEVHDGFCFAHDVSNSATAANEIGIFVGFDGDAPAALRHLATSGKLRVHQLDADTSAVLNRRFRSQFDWSG